MGVEGHSDLTKHIFGPYSTVHMITRITSLRLYTSAHQSSRCSWALQLNKRPGHWLQNDKMSEWSWPFDLLNIKCFHLITTLFVPNSMAFFEDIAFTRTRRTSWKCKRPRLGVIITMSSRMKWYGKTADHSLSHCQLCSLLSIPRQR